MPEDHIRYDLLAQAALRGVVRTVLGDAAKKGLPGHHHFKITFDTTAPGVRIPERIRARYPADMTIVLQHQFWDLTVNELAFEVGLSFDGIGERVVVPFDAIIAFVDPAVQFGIQFEIIESAEAEKSPTAVNKPASKPQSLPAPAAAEEVEPAEQPPPAADDGGEVVVRLDRFRKK
jgi:uncharacterized protein